MTVGITVGTRFPAFATSMGRVLLAHAPPDELDAYFVAADLTPPTPRTVHTETDLRSLLGEVAEQGWAEVDQELEPGLYSLAAPIRDADRRVVAAINVSTTSPERPAQLRDDVLARRRCDQRRPGQHRSALSQMSSDRPEAPDGGRQATMLGMNLVIIAIFGVLAVVGVNALAPRLGVAAPLLLVLLGVGVSFIPRVGPIDINPELILAGILPPLLYSTAVAMPTMEFRRDFRTISVLSVVLVVVSAVVVGVIMHLLIPGLDLALGIALGAILSPTDAVATSIVRKAGVSQRIVTVLEGESLLNDASALVLLRSAVAAVGVGISFGEVSGQFVYSVIVAVAVGWAVGRLNLLVRSHLNQATSSVAVSLIVPFVAYVPAEQLDASGLVAAVTAGLISGHGAPARLRAEDRITERAVWRTVELLLESAVFLIMGLEISTSDRRCPRRARQCSGRARARSGRRARHRRGAVGLHRVVALVAGSSRATGRRGPGANRQRPATNRFGTVATAAAAPRGRRGGDANAGPRLAPDGSRRR